MIRRAPVVLILAALLSASGARAENFGRNPAELKPVLQRLVDAYPGTIAGFDAGALILKNGERLPLSDGDEGKSFEQMLDRPDIGDMFAFAYPAGAEAAPPPENFDPGRIRVEALFRALYGDCQKGEVAGKLRRIAWVPGHGGGKVSVTTAQGADKALEAVSRDLDKLPASFRKYLVPSAGTYNCRAIAKTSRMSMHAYGAAIDLNTKYTAYWQWQKPDAAGHIKWSNRIPKEIVDIFERHGFIWGGRWYHYDTMHFEYRPEMLAR